MKYGLKNCNLALFSLLSLASVSSIQAAITGTASATVTPLNPLFQYNLVLNDTGTTDIGTFWFSWIPGQNFMPVAPTNVLSPASWTSSITNGGATDGFGIRWVASSPAAALTPGTSLSGFQFTSSMTPAEFQGISAFHPSPVGTSFVYIGAAFADPGFQFDVTVVPEPATIALTALGLGLAGIRLRRKR